jgi:hypothetical protein
VTHADDGRRRQETQTTAHRALQEQRRTLNSRETRRVGLHLRLELQEHRCARVAVYVQAYLLEVADNARHGLARHAAELLRPLEAQEELLQVCECVVDARELRVERLHVSHGVLDDLQGTSDASERPSRAALACDARRSDAAVK